MPQITLLMAALQKVAIAFSPARKTHPDSDVSRWLVAHILGLTPEQTNERPRDDHGATSDQ